MTATAMNRVQACVRFFDRWGTPVPADWSQRIDTARLDMASVVNDVAGQLFGLYRDGVDVLGLTEDQAVGLGLSCDGDPEDCVALTIAWVVTLDLRNRKAMAA